MAKLNYNFFHGEKGLIHKNLIEYKILNVVKDSSDKNFDDYLKTTDSIEEFCYLSSVRKNILNWYPFKSNARLLEVGAGVGSLTGLFCDKVKDVVSVEMTDVRAEIINEWHKDRENLEIMVGNFNEMTFDEKFDYIVLIGVFEYSKRFLESENAHVELLKHLKSLLKPNGIILIGIENRLGLKYFSGCMEEHTGKLFLGLNSYDEYDYIRTFSKSELEEIANDAGMENYRFMYPFPSYGYPCAIYSDEILPYIEFGQSYSIPRSDYFEFFNEFRMYKTLQADKIVTNFSNSFLLELFNGKLPDEKILYAKLPIYKKEQDKIATIITEKNSRKLVKKYSLMQNFEKIKKYIDIYQQVSGHIDKKHFEYVEAKWNKDHVEMPFIEKISLEKILNKQLNLALKCNNENQEIYQKFIDEIIAAFKNIAERWQINSIKSNQYHTEEFSKYFGNLKIIEELNCINYANIDCNVEDFFIDNATVYVIDYENIVDFFVPVEFLIFKLINSWYNKNVLNYKNAEKILDIMEIYRKCDINTENLDIYKSWNKFCYNKIYSCQVILNFDKKGYSPDFIDVKNVKKHGAMYNNEK